MNSLLLLIVGIILFFIAYVTYGSFLAKEWGIDVKRETPACTHFDNTDFCPTDSKVLLGHHFSSIAGAGPITGPILATIFGWLPVYLWVVIGSIFVGGVHDFGSLLASVRHEGKTIGEIIRVNVGARGKMLFNLFAWLALVLVVAAFTDITASTFAFNPATPEAIAGAQAGTASILFIFLAIGFGITVHRQNANLAVSTIAGVALLAGAIWVGFHYPFIKLSVMQWRYLLLVYIFFASVLPVWLLLQPRDYLNSFLLYAMLLGGIVGVIVYRPTLQLAASTGFAVGSGATTTYLFPMLFVTVACGAVSGFHSLVSSGTTSKQIAGEKDVKFVGYGAMLLEGVVAILALISVAYITTAEGTPVARFAAGLSTFMNSFGLPIPLGRVFVTLAFSAFALTSLDSATRIARYVFQEFFDKGDGTESLLTNKYVATIITVACSLGLVFYGYARIWPIFGTTNQMLAAMALLAISTWLARSGRKTWMTMIPMVFMFAVTLTALVFSIRNFFLGKLWILFGLGIGMLILAVILILETISVMGKAKTEGSKA
jgi:carbon starvation protein